MNEHKSNIEPKITGRDYLIGCDFGNHPNKKSSRKREDCESDVISKIIDFMSQRYFRKNDAQIFMYDGSRYVELKNDDLLTLIIDVLRENGYSSVYWYNSSEKIMKYIRSTKYIRKFNPKRQYVCFKNGIYDLELSKMIEPREDIEAYVYIDHIYDPVRQRGRLFFDFLDTVLPDKSVQRVLQQALGYMFVDRSMLKLEQAFYLLGEGANGKSVISDLLEYTLGEDNMSGYSMEELLIDNDKLKNRAEISGKLINFCSDMGKKDYSGGDYKKMISGERMNCRRMYKDPFSTKLIPLMFASVNEYPSTTDHSTGHTRRNIIIPFNVTIKKEDQDRELGVKLREYVSVFLKWIFDGYYDIRDKKGHFDECKVIEEAGEKVKRESNTVLLFLYEKYYFGKIPDDGYEYTFKTETLKYWYDEYVYWYNEEGYNKNFITGKIKFAKLFESSDFEKIENTRNRSKSFKIYYRTGNILDKNIDVEEQKIIDELPF